MSVKELSLAYRNLIIVRISDFNWFSTLVASKTIGSYFNLAITLQQNGALAKVFFAVYKITIGGIELEVWPFSPFFGRPSAIHE